jgi:Domain of unknown function (DUF4340)
VKRNTLILLACSALLLGGYALLGQRGAEVPEAERVLPGFDPRQVRALQIERPGRSAIRLSRKTGADIWRLTQPLRGRADPAAVAGILSRLEFLEPVRSLTETNLKQLGLSPPAVKLTLELGAAREVLELGRPDPSGRGVYLRVKSRHGRALVVERELLDALRAEADTLRHRALITLEAAALQSVELTAAQGRFRLLRGAKTGWTLQLAGHALRAHPQLSARLVATLLGLRASRFAARPAGAVEQARLELTHAGSSGRGRIVVAIGGPCVGQPEERWVVVDRVEACVPAKALRPLLLPGDRLRDLSVSWLQEHELAAISIRGAEGRVSLQRDGGAWIVGRGATKRPAEHARVRAWVDALRGLPATLEPCTAQRLGALGLGGAEVVLGLDGEDRRETLRIGAVSGERRPLRRGAEQAVLWVDAQALGRLLEVSADRFTEQAKP